MLKISGRVGNISRFLLMVMVGVVALAAFFAFFVVAEVFFPGMGLWAQVAVGLVGGLLIGSIDWMIVFPYSSGQGNPAGGAPVVRRLNRAVPVLTGVLLVAFISFVALGPALNIAMNKEAVQGELVKEEIARVQKGFDEEAVRARDEAAEARALQAKNVEDWNAHFTTLEAQVAAAEAAVVEANAVMDAAEVKYKCELGEAVGAQCNGISASSGAGRDRAAAILTEARKEWEEARANLTTVRAERDLHLADRPGKSADPVRPVDVVARVATVDDIDPASLSGLQVTFQAWDAVSADWGWGLKYGPGIVLFFLMLMPIVMKVLAGGTEVKG